MPIRSSYAAHGDACAAAHGFEVLGEIWTYPILREMFLGPKRFSELLDLVRGITPAVLTTRLRELTARGLVHGVTLPPPARGRAYELTDWGHALEPVIEEVARWAHGSPTWRTDGGLTPDGVVLAMKTMALAEVTDPIAMQLELTDARLARPQTYVYRLDWDADGLRAARGPHERPAAIIRSDSTTWARTCFFETPLEAASVIGGDPDEAQRLVDQFRTR